MHCQPLPCKPLSFMLLLSIGFGITTNINDWLKRCKFSCSLQHFSQQLAKNRNLTALSISVCLCHSYLQLLHSLLCKEEVNCLPDLIEGAMNMPCLRKLYIEVPLSLPFCVSLLIKFPKSSPYVHDMFKTPQSLANVGKMLKKNTSLKKLQLVGSSFPKSSNSN